MTQTTGIKAAIAEALAKRHVKNVDGFTVEEMTEALTAFGFEIHSPNAVANSLNQSFGRGEMKRVGSRGHYLYGVEWHPPQTRKGAITPTDPLQNLLEAMQAAIPELKVMIKLRNKMREMV